MWTLLALSALAAPVTFQVNDALVKDRPLAEAKVRATGDGEPIDLGVTDASGALVADLAPGTWQIAYAKAGYVPIPGSPTDIPAEGTTVTVALSPLLEATGDVGRNRVQIVLTWGSYWSDARDLDAHLVCADNKEVYFALRDHVADGHEVRLDVDDIDWGGPETITLVDAPPGRYEYFVRNFSGTAAQLATSGVVVRVVSGDAPVGEYRPRSNLSGQDWLPFRALVVETDGSARIEPFDPEEVAQGLDRRGFPLFQGGCDSCMGGLLCPVALGVMWLIAATQGKRLRRLFR